MICAGFTKALQVAAPRRADKASPWLNVSTIPADAIIWLTAEAFDDLTKAHGIAVCELTPNYNSVVWGWSIPQRMSALRVIDCPTCDAGRANRMTACPLCRGATRLFNL